MLYDALIPSLEEVGARFERGDFFVPEMLIAARAMQGALDILRPLLAETGARQVGTYVMGTVKGDVHDIGKNLVNIMLEGAGFTVHDLGVNVAPEVFIEAINEHQPDIVGFSAFLTTTMRNGPCGGVRPDGTCEVKPEMRCVWVKAVERAPKTPWAHEINDLRPPVDNRLWGTSSWRNFFTKRDRLTPKGWRVSA